MPEQRKRSAPKSREKLRFDPRVEEDLRRFKMLEPMDLYAKARTIGREG
jgi:hypothetical protein